MGESRAAESFHAHLDVCDRCARRPFDLCEQGAVLLKLAAGTPLPPPPAVRTPGGCPDCKTQLSCFRNGCWPE